MLDVGIDLSTQTVLTIVVINTIVLLCLMVFDQAVIKGFIMKHRALSVVVGCWTFLSLLVLLISLFNL